MEAAHGQSLRSEASVADHALQETSPLQTGYCNATLGDREKRLTEIRNVLLSGLFEDFVYFLMKCFLTYEKMKPSRMFLESLCFGFGPGVP